MVAPWSVHVSVVHMYFGHGSQRLINLECYSEAIPLVFRDGLLLRPGSWRLG